MMSKEFHMPTGSIKDFLKYDSRYKLATLCLVLFICNIGLIGFFVRLANFLPFDSKNTVWFFSNLILGIFDFLALIESYHKKNSVWKFYFLFYSFLLLSYVFKSPYNYWFDHEEYGWRCLLSLRLGVFGILVTSFFYDEEKLLNAVVMSAKGLFVLSIIQSIIFFARGGKVSYSSGVSKMLEYDMGMGYSFSFCSTVFLLLFYYHKTFWNFFMLLLSIYFSVVLGSRGALLPIVTVGIFYFFIFRFIKANFKRKFLFMVALFIMFSILLIFEGEILSGLKYVVYNLGVKSRTLDMIVSGNIDDMNGRSKIYEYAIQFILESPLIGYGFYGDRFLLGRYVYWGYPHNFFLEIFLNFGLPLGIIIILYLFYKLYYMLHRCKDDYWNILIAIFLANSLKLLVSDSYVYNMYFWLLIGTVSLWYCKRGKISKT